MIVQKLSDETGAQILGDVLLETEGDLAAEKEARERATKEMVDGLKSQVESLRRDLEAERSARSQEAQRVIEMEARLREAIAAIPQPQFPAIPAYPDLSADFARLHAEIAKAPAAHEPPEYEFIMHRRDDGLLRKVEARVKRK